MNILRKKGLNRIKHDCIFGADEDFLLKIPVEDDEVKLVGNPYPVTPPAALVNENTSENTRKHTRQVKREFEKYKVNILDNDLRLGKNVLLPNFLLDYMDEKISQNVEFGGYNMEYSQGILEQFTFEDRTFLVRPNCESNLVCTDVSTGGNHTKIIEYRSASPILNIQSVNKDGQYLTVRSRHDFSFSKLDNFTLDKKLCLSSKIGYFGTKISQFDVNELGILDRNLKFKTFDLEAQKITANFENIFLPTTYGANMDFVSPNEVLINSDKELKLVDTRSQTAAMVFNIKLNACDNLVNFIPDGNSIYLTSMHKYFVHDLRQTDVKEYVHHNLKAAPCFLRKHKSQDKNFVCLLSQDAKEKVLMGHNAGHSLPYRLSSIWDTYKICRRQLAVPVVPHLKARWERPILGVQLIPSEENVSIYAANDLGELYVQKIFFNQRDYLQNYDYSMTALLDWVLLLQGHEHSFSAVHLANGSHLMNLQGEKKEELEDDNVDTYLNMNKFEPSVRNEGIIAKFNAIWDVI